MTLKALWRGKNDLAEREKTRKDEPLDQLDTKPSSPELKRSEDEEAEPEKHEFIYRVTAPPPMDAKARYDAFLRSRDRPQHDRRRHSRKWSYVCAHH